MNFLEMLIQQSINGLMLGIMYSLIAVGFTLYFGVLNVINFAHGDFFMLGGFMALILFSIAESLGWVQNSIWLVTYPLCRFHAPDGCNRHHHLPIGHPAGEQGSDGDQPAGHAGTGYRHPRGRACSLSREVQTPKVFLRCFPRAPFNIGEVVIRYENIIIFAVGIALIILVNLLITKTKVGSAIRAVAQDGEAAMMMGVNLDQTIDITFLVGSAVAAVAGIMNGFYYGQVMFNMGAVAGVIGFSAAVIGGLGNVYGAIAGGILFGLLETFAAAFLPGGSENKRVFAFFIVILFLIFKPTGILGEKVYERV